jgi:hypothetical protein
LLIFSRVNPIILDLCSSLPHPTVASLLPFCHRLYSACKENESLKTLILPLSYWKPCRGSPLHRRHIKIHLQSCHVMWWPASSALPSTLGVDRELQQAWPRLSSCLNFASAPTLHLCNRSEWCLIYCSK